MKRIILASALVAFGMAAAPLTIPAAQPLNMAVSFSPNPPQQGTETLTVVLTDGARKPVNGALVSIATSMPTMSMGGPTIKATQARAGIYVAKVNLNFATQWKFDVSAKSGAQSVAYSYTQNIK